jgi:hypothetical protein
MQHFSCNLSKEVGRIRDWKGPMWARRYSGIVVSDEPEAQWRRMSYILSHSVKEGLTATPGEWPGVHCADSLATGEPLEGYWFNRSKEWAARNRGLTVERYDYATRYLVDFSPLPAFRHLDPEEYREKIKDEIVRIEKKYERERDGNPVAGVEKILVQNPYQRPTARPPRSDACPLFHVHTREAKELLRVEFNAFRSIFLEGAEMLRSCGRDLEVSNWFPAGCYPPALPFTGEAPPPCPPAPPTRQLIVQETKILSRGPIPTVEIPGTWSSPEVRGQPPP